MLNYSYFNLNQIIQNFKNLDILYTTFFVYPEFMRSWTALKEYIYGP